MSERTEITKEQVALKEPLFEVGRIVATNAAIEAMNKYGLDGFWLLARHVRGDWGIVCEEDAKENETSVKYDFRIMSVYPLDPTKPEDRDHRIWIITEADRSSTTILLPDDY